MFYVNTRLVYVSFSDLERSLGIATLVWSEEGAERIVGFSDLERSLGIATRLDKRRRDQLREFQ